jgi:hypothetical protein
MSLLGPEAIRVRSMPLKLRNPWGAIREQQQASPDGPATTSAYAGSVNDLDVDLLADHDGGGSRGAP